MTRIGLLHDREGETALHTALKVRKRACVKLIVSAIFTLYTYTLYLILYTLGGQARLRQADRVGDHQRPHHAPALGVGTSRAVPPPCGPQPPQGVHPPHLV